MKEKNKSVKSLNKTGIDKSPEDSQRMREFSNQSAVTPQAPDGSERADADLLKDYHSDENSMGSIPKGDTKSVLIDKLGQRLAFERMGIRLYDQIIQKVKHDPACEGIVSPGVLDQFRTEESEHFRLLQDMMKELGADPTAETPCANASGVASSGILKVISDPQSSSAQAFEALLSAEATDNAGWELLIELIVGSDLEEKHTELFNKALEQEAEHLRQIREYLYELVMLDVQVA